VCVLLPPNICYVQYGLGERCYEFRNHTRVVLILTYKIDLFFSYTTRSSRYKNKKKTVCLVWGAWSLYSSMWVIIQSISHLPSWCWWWVELVKGWRVTIRIVTHGAIVTTFRACALLFFRVFFCEFWRYICWLCANGWRLCARAGDADALRLRIHWEVR